MYRLQTSWIPSSTTQVQPLQRQSILLVKSQSTSEIPSTTSTTVLRIVMVRQPLEAVGASDLGPQSASQSTQAPPNKNVQAGYQRPRFGPNSYPGRPAPDHIIKQRASNKITNIVRWQKQNRQKKLEEKPLLIQSHMTPLPPLDDQDLGCYDQDGVFPLYQSTKTPVAQWSCGHIQFSIAEHTYETLCVSCSGRARRDAPGPTPGLISEHSSSPETDSAHSRERICVNCVQRIQVTMTNADGPIGEETCPDCFFRESLSLLQAATNDNVSYAHTQTEYSSPASEVSNIPCKPGIAEAALHGYGPYEYADNINGRKPGF